MLHHTSYVVYWLLCTRPNVCRKYSNFIMYPAYSITFNNKVHSSSLKYIISQMHYMVSCELTSLCSLVFSASILVCVCVCVCVCVVRACVCVSAGLMGTAATLVYGAYAYKNRGPMSTSRYLMRLRVVAQSAVVLSMILGASWSSMRSSPARTD